MQRTLAMLCVLTASLAACSRDDSAVEPAMTGRVHANAPVKLGASTRLELQLTDVSVMDGPAMALARKVIKEPDALPYSYTLPYSPDQIDDSRRYTIEARIYVDDTLRYVTDAAYAVLTQGKGAQQDLLVVAAGGLASTPLANTQNPLTNLIQGELRTADAVTLYRAGVQDNSIAWLEEERSNNTPKPFQARYEYKGALLQRYRDGAGVEMEFDERGRPRRLLKQNKVVALNQEYNLLNDVRNRADLLRSHALATRETQAHRQATENWKGNSGLSTFASGR